MKWYSPKGVDIRANSVNDSGINTFTSNVVESLVRETIQNSLDAANKKAAVFMEFELADVDIKNYIDISHFNEEAIPCAFERWNKDEKALTFLKRFSDTLNSDKLHILKISDYNTTGLEENQWQALVNEAGSSFKLNSDAGGSFGIGKSAPFASSDLRMVFYNTKTCTDVKSIGITRFISYDIGKYTTEGILYLGKDKREPFDYQTVFGFDNRDETGTDIFIVGFNRIEEWKDVIIKTILNNFMVSIYSGKFEVKVSGDIINKESLGMYLNEYICDPTMERTVKYYNVLLNPEKIVIELSALFKKYGFHSKDAKLVIAESENSTRNVLMTRSTGMQIYEMNRITSTIQFDGVFMAEGEEINRILRSMENPAHDSWDADIIIDPELRLKYKSLKYDLFKFIKDSVLEAYKTETKEVIDAMGINEFLPSGNSSKKEEENLDFSISSITLRPATERRKKSPKDDKAEPKTRTEPGGTQGGDGKGGEPVIEPGDRMGSGGVEGTGEEQETDDGNNIRNSIKKLTPAKLKSLYYRIIETDYLNGEYILSLSSEEDYDGLYIEIKTIDENESDYSTKILNVKQDYEIIADNEIIKINQIQQDNDYRIEIKVDSDSRKKLEVVLYENN